jgi:DNA-binding response OmpR family regulator
VRVLVVEDEPLIAEALVRALERERLAVDVAGDGETALDAINREGYDLIVLDLVLPGIDGLDVCRQIRRADTNTPVIMLTARDSLEDKVLGLDSGADDYVTKPFELEELMARVRSLLRRARPAPAAPLRSAGLLLDGDTREVRLADRRVRLTDTEFRLLEHLMRRAGEVCRRQELLQYVWGYSFDPGSNVVDVFIRRLRHRLEAAGTDAGGAAPPRIETIRGIGYRFLE